MIYSWQIHVGCHISPLDGYTLLDYFLQIWERNLDKLTSQWFLSPSFSPSFRDRNSINPPLLWNLFYYLSSLKLSNSSEAVPDVSRRVALQSDFPAEVVAAAIAPCPITPSPLGMAELGAGPGTVIGLKNNLFFHGDRAAGVPGSKLAGDCEHLTWLEQWPLNWNVWPEPNIALGISEPLGLKASNFHWQSTHSLL